MVNHSNPIWIDEEIELLLENYNSKEMYELQGLLARCYFPRPAEGIKRKLEKLLASGQFTLDKKRVKHLSARKLWPKDTYEKYKERLKNWRKENPGYFSRWFKEHPDYLKNWFSEHKGYSKIARERFLERQPNYDRNYKSYIRKRMDLLLSQIFCNNTELPLKEISKGIDKLAGVYIKERTLEKLLGKYEGLPRGPPVVKTEAGNYQLNPSFYKN